MTHTRNPCQGELDRGLKVSLQGHGKPTTATRKIKRNTKTGTVLNALAQGRRFHRFTAEREYHDHTLPSTISTLQQIHGIRVEREYVQVRGYRGNPTTVAEYWLTADEKVKASRMLENESL